MTDRRLAVSRSQLYPSDVRGWDAMSREELVQRIQAAEQALARREAELLEIHRTNMRAAQWDEDYRIGPLEREVAAAEARLERVRQVIAERRLEIAAAPHPDELSRESRLLDALWVALGEETKPTKVWETEQ